MEFTLTPDQEALRGELRRSLADRFDPDVRRAAMDQPGAVDRTIWSVLADTGVFALCLPEDGGGVGLGLADAVLVFEELGRAAVPGPLVGTFLAATSGVVPGAATGERVVGLVEAVPDGPTFVEHLDGLDDLVVLSGGDVSVVAAADLAGRACRPTDPLTPVSIVDDLPGATPAGSDAGRWRRDAGLLAAALQVGLAAAAVDMGVAYAKERVQFGKPIGSFQAIKHLLADAHTAVELARTAVQAAAVGLDEAVPDAESARAVASARLVASRAGHTATTTNIQVHGGMGYTWELDAHLLLKRVLVVDQSPSTVEDALDARAAALA